MTDLERFIELYRSIGIECYIYEDEEKWRTKEIKLGAAMYPSGDEFQSHPLIEGYGGFYTSIVFDKDGKFISQGFWE